jgi:2-polyprenyl-3-methyl-5-hydroxy-6-metoxy-1,4-benzoquinol methylase
MDDRWHATIAQSLFQFRASADYQNPSVNNFWYWHSTRLLQAIREAYRALPTEHPLIVDVGCGDGLLLSRIMRQTHSRGVIGLDINAMALQFVAAESRYHGMESRVIPVRANLYILPIPTESADIVICSEVVEHLTDDTQALREIQRILKPGGALILTTPNDGNLLTRAWAMLKYRKTGMASLALSSETPAERWTADNDTEAHGHINVHTAEYWVKKLAAAGTRVERIWPVTPSCGSSRLSRRSALFAMTLIAQSLISDHKWGHHFSDGIVIWATRTG